MKRRLIPRLLRRLTRPSAAGVTVFAFHGVVERELPAPDGCWTPLAVFRAQVQSIAARFEVVPLPVAMTTPAPAGRRRAALTFDDGFQSHHDLVLPVLQELGLHATFFINTGVVDTAHGLWFARLHAAISETTLTRLEWGGGTYLLPDAERRGACSAALQTRLKALPAPELECAVDAIREQLGCDPRPCFAPTSPFRALDTASLRTMFASGLCGFGGHTHSHAILSRLSPAAQREEITRSIAGVRELGLGAAEAFAYPNGQPGDFGADAERILGDLGVRWAFGTHGGLCSAASRPFRLPRRVLMAGHRPIGVRR